jgi:stalled ribosome rescue protein Dom34
MKREVSRHVAIWIDSYQAVLLAFEAEPFDRSTLYSLGTGCSQHRVDAQEYPSMQQYYEAVISHLQSQDEILILGPGRAKDQLCQRIEQRGNLKGKVVGLQHAPKLAKVELVFPTKAACAPKGKLKASFRSG